jgi:hypothetical protein
MSNNNNAIQFYNVFTETMKASLLKYHALGLQVNGYQCLTTSALNAIYTETKDYVEFNDKICNRYARSCSSVLARRLLKRIV